MGHEEMADGGVDVPPSGEAGQAEWPADEVVEVEPLSLEELRYRCALLSERIHAHLEGRTR